ncbi:carotenoid biosynthesis protein [Rufibacter latericius]|uniref:Carotenoid biosynthesis protein n=1 Tax=Rufibacter latericius TaxID=2487040 RepID=A0A3M9MD03_9BACT|nr:carotenoid biosynthesis protein [Rufibacter latericius]RNI23394.1 carotenoid biosynthesis protein [Rufibacter latericius]
MKELTAPLSINKLQLSVGVICLFHVCGLIGFYTPFRDWFLSNTPLNLILATGLLLWNHQGLTVKMVVGAVAVFLVGLTAEIIGVATGKVFGAYHYGEAFGPKFMAVPLVIGMNWAALCFAAVAVVNQWKKSYLEKAAVAAAIPVSIDFLIEQVCETFDFWYWDNHTPPLQNYLAWYGFSFLFALVLIPLLKNSRNLFAPYFLLVQFVFFLLLNLAELVYAR